VHPPRPADAPAADPAAPPPASPRSALRAARTERGWSQTDAAARLHDLVRAGGGGSSAASLKTQLSRWENGHALPDPASRQLLVELYGRSAAELDLLPRPTGGSPRERLLGELAAAAAADDAVVAQWGLQVAAALRLDDELGAAGSGEVTAALVAQLSRTLVHTLGTARRAAVALPLAAAAVLAARHALDRDDPATAWAHGATAATAAEVAGSDAAVAAAAVARADVLRELGDPDAAQHLLAATRTRLGGGPGTARVAAAQAVAWAELGRAADARTALAEARGALAALDVGHPPDLLRIELADLEHGRGRALALLRDDAAAQALAGALAGGPRSVRHRAELHADLAGVHRSAGRGAAAAEHAEQARRLARRIGSTALLRSAASTAAP
jgi:transcriptional regulator with XRE-family HTH domain